MTYCLSIRLGDGLVFLSDTRTNAGVDNISLYRKLHVLQPAPDQLFVIQSAGNLATTQEVLDRIERDLHAGDGRETIGTAQHLFEAALYLGRISRDVVVAHQDALSSVGADGTATFLLGGQVGDHPPEIFLVYPEGNYIRGSRTRPFLQIGETKYGKAWLELLIMREQTDLDVATKIALASMLGTARANLSVGPPYDLAVYRPGTFVLDQHRIDEDSAYLRELQSVFTRHLVQATDELPPIPWGEV